MMKKYFTTILMLLAVFAAKSQCRQYIEFIAPQKLQPYTPDGNFFSPVVTEGQKVSLKRTFIAGKKYKIAVVGFELLDKKILITDQDGFIVFANYQVSKKFKPQSYTDSEGNEIPWIGSNVFEFSPQQTVNLKITVKIEKKARRKKDRLKGCIGIIVGYKN